MPFDPITAALEIGGKIIDRLFPDPTAAAAAKLELIKLEQSGDLAKITGQLEINKIEAANPSLFVAGARPFVMWVCAFGLMYVSIIEPIARFIASVIYHYTGAFPIIDTTITIQVLLGLLGLGAMRSYDKKQGTDTKEIN